MTIFYGLGGEMGYLNSKQLLIAKGPLEIFYEPGGIKIYWQGRQLTAGCGLHTAVNTLGLWSDSSYANWEILKKQDQGVILKNIWQKLPLTCIWRLRIEKDYRVSWEIDMEVEEVLEIDEQRVVILTRPDYKTWINSYEEAKFPQIIGWQDMPLENSSSKLVGLRFSKDNLLPSLALEFENNKYGTEAPLIQNTSPDINGRLIGVRLMNFEGNKTYREGIYPCFKGSVEIFTKEKELDGKIEARRKNMFESTKRMVKAYKNRKPKVLLANFPWQQNGAWGVRAGSRWPHIKDRSEGNYLPFPFFLAYAASLLKKNDIPADLIDAVASAVPRDKFIADLPKREFDILVTETSVPSFFYDLEILREVSNLGVPVVLSGPQPEIYKPQFLEKNNFIDFVLFGEYEFSLLELIKAISSGKKDFSSVAGLIWRDGKGNVVKNGPREPFDINLLPWPYRQGLPMEKYWDLPGDIPHPSAQIVASRGCPFGCSFCLWPQVLFGGRTYRTREVKDLIDEMEFLVREKGFKSVYFDDDTFNIGKERMLKICNEIIKRDLNNTPWAIMAKADLMDKEILGRMKEAGLAAVKYGVESVAQDLVDGCGKCLDLNKAKAMIEYTKSLGIGVHLTFSFGLPGETKDTIKKSIDYALKSEPHSVQFSIITPFPGTTLFEQLDAKGKILSKDWSLYDGHSSCVFEPDNLSPSDLEEAKQYAYRLWADSQRKKRGFWGDAKRFFNYWQNYGPGESFKKTGRYFNYLLTERKKFIGKI